MADITLTRYDCDYKDKRNNFVSRAKNGIFLSDCNYKDYHSDRFTIHSLIFKEREDIIAILPARREGVEIKILYNKEDY